MTELIAAFEIVGEPVSKGRPRFAMVNGRPRTYTPNETVQAERVVADAFRAAAPSYTPEPGFVYSLHAMFHMGTLRHKDTDNMLKLIMDALNGVAYSDDHELVEIYARKVFVLKKSAAKTVLHITRAPALNKPRNTKKGNA